MVFACCAYGCSNRQGRESVSFYRIPADPERRQLWIAALGMKDWTPSPYDRLCSAHFVTGEKSNNPLSPDYVPSIFKHVSSPVKRKQVQRMESFERQQARKKALIENNKRTVAAEGLLGLFTSSAHMPENAVDNEVLEIPEVPSMDSGTSTMTETSAQDIKNLEDECQTLRSECSELKQKLVNVGLSEDELKNNPEKVKFYTGLPNLSVMMALLKIISPHLTQGNLGPFHQFLLTLMRLRLNLNVQDLAYRFGIHVSTVSRVFTNTVHVCFVRLVPLLVKWPEREELRLTMPQVFRKSFRNCVSINDCFEIFTERPSDLKARSQTYSNYKSHNTVKYLISITPQGTVNFISKGWGGRASDKHITENCGILDKIVYGDVILADRGFDMKESFGLVGGALEIPAFTKGKAQLERVEVEKTREIASVRIHVERVIGVTRQKYTMLQSTAPITLLKGDENGFTLLDKIVAVACAFTNVSESIIPFD